jgi:hypothetical protein
LGEKKRKKEKRKEKYFSCRCRRIAPMTRNVSCRRIATMMRNVMRLIALSYVLCLCLTFSEFRSTKQSHRMGRKDQEEDKGLGALVYFAPAVAGSWGLAGVAAGTAWWRLPWESALIEALTSLQYASIAPSLSFPFPHIASLSLFPAFSSKLCASRAVLAMTKFLMLSLRHVTAALEIVPGAATGMLAFVLVSTTQRHFRDYLLRIHRPVHSPLLSSISCTFLPALASTSAFLCVFLGVTYKGRGEIVRAGAVVGGKDVWLGALSSWIVCVFRGWKDIWGVGGLSLLVPWAVSLQSYPLNLLLKKLANAAESSLRRFFSGSGISEW